jgi:N-acetylmuramoyl-L-alanine amidase
VFLRLRDRIGVARRHKADLFVSIHADSIGNPKVRGLSVYTLSENASDGEAHALAESENKADIIAGIDLSHESVEVTNILIDLAQRETMNLSARMAQTIVGELKRETTLLPRSHRFAGFAVLKAPDVPSVLVELGYLSNPDEERMLRTGTYREKLGRAFVRSLDNYFDAKQKASR